MGPYGLLGESRNNVDRLVIICSVCRIEKRRWLSIWQIITLRKYHYRMPLIFVLEYLIFPEKKRNKKSVMK